MVEEVTTVVVSGGAVCLGRGSTERLFWSTGHILYLDLDSGYTYSSIYIQTYLYKHIQHNGGTSLVAQMVKNLLSMQSLNQEGPLEEEMATYPSSLAWTIPRT